MADELGPMATPLPVIIIWALLSAWLLYAGLKMIPTNQTSNSKELGVYGIEMYEPLVMLPFLVQSDATEADLTGFLKQLHRPRSPEMRMSAALARV